MDSGQTEWRQLHKLPSRSVTLSPSLIFEHDISQYKSESYVVFVVVVFDVVVLIVVVFVVVVFVVVVFIVVAFIVVVFVVVVMKFEEPFSIFKKLVPACDVNVIHPKALLGSVLYVKD